MISGNRDEAWPMYLAWPIPERFMLGVIRWHVTCMLSLAGHWQDRRALSNHVCAHSVIPMWHVVCLQHLARASSEQSRSTTVLPTNHVIQIPQCLSGFVNHDYYSAVPITFVYSCRHYGHHKQKIMHFKFHNDIEYIWIHINTISFSFLYGFLKTNIGIKLEKKNFLTREGGGGLFVSNRAFLCVEPGFFVSNHAFCCRTGLFCVERVL